MAGVADHPKRDEMEELWRNGNRAGRINDYLVSQGYDKLNPGTLGRYGQRFWTEGEGLAAIRVDLDEDDDLDAQLQEARDIMDKVRAQNLGKVRRITIGSKKYPTWERKRVDEPAVSVEKESKARSIEIVPNEDARAPVERATLPDIRVSISKVQQSSKGGWKVGVFLPDMQIGYFRDRAETFCTQDEAAIDVAHQIIGTLEQMYGVDSIVNAGDNLDFPQFSTKHRSAPGFWGTVQDTIDRGAAEAAVQRALAPNAEIFWLQGNHEARLTNYLIDSAPPLVGLTRAGGDEPVLSVPYLCKFDEVNVTFIDGYPDGEIWMNRHLRFEHGALARAGAGTTAAAHLKNGVSVCYGHIHRFELLQQTRNTKNGPRTHFAGSPGCLCKLTGAVPSAKTGITARGTQGRTRSEDWQNGIFVYWYQTDGDQLTAIEPVSIWSGWALYRGVEYNSTVTPDGEPLGT